MHVKWLILSKRCQSACEISESYWRRKKQKVRTWSWTTGKQRLSECRKRYLEMWKSNFKVIKYGFSFLVIRVDRNSAILGQPRFQFLAIRIVANAAILGQPGIRFYL